MEHILKKFHLLGFLSVFLSSCLAHQSDETKPDQNPSALIDSEDAKENGQEHILSRVEALENQIFKQNQKIRLLEKNLKVERQKKQKLDLAKTVKKKGDILEKIPQTVQVSKKITLPKTYEMRIYDAKSLYNKHIWQKAYLAFSQIDREFNANITKGEPSYWMGMCWYRMKEYDSAKSILKNFIATYPNHELGQSAQFYLAKSYVGMGKSREAMSTLRKLVRLDTDGQTTGDAKQLLKTLENENL